MSIFTHLPLDRMDEDAYFSASAALTPLAVSIAKERVVAILAEYFDMDLYSFTVD